MIFFPKLVSADKKKSIRQILIEEEPTIYLTVDDINARKSLRNCHIQKKPKDTPEYKDDKLDGNLEQQKEHEVKNYGFQLIILSTLVH